jgi:hypothetical protein
MPYGDSDMNSIGKIEHGIDTNGDSRSRKMKTTRLVGSIESGKDVNSRLKGRGSARAGRRFVKTASMLLVVCAAAIFVVSAFALTEVSQKTASIKAPPGTAHTLIGYTYAADGVTGWNGCFVVVKNTATGESITYDNNHPDWDPSIPIYNIDAGLFTLGWNVGDLLNFTATNGVAIGYNESFITTNQPDITDITLNMTYTPIPEFPMVILPVGGMIALFAVVSLRRKGKEQ